MTAIPKQSRIQCPEYLDFIRTRLCVVCGGAVDPHHVKPKCDFSAVPLCRKHHTECHAIGRKTFQEKYNLDFADLIRGLTRRWINQQLREWGL